MKAFHFRIKASVLLPITLIALGVLNMGSHVAYATDMSRQQRICPVDQTQLTIFLLLSLRSFGTRSDLSIDGMPYEIFFNSCPVCHFSGKQSDFTGPVSPQVKDHVLSHWKPFLAGQKLEALTSLEITLDIYIFQKRSAFDIAQLALDGSYMLYPESHEAKVRTSPPKRRYFQALAAQYFEQAWTNKQVPQEQLLQTAYLIGELYRRLALFKKSIPWYDIALRFTNPNKNFIELIQHQRQLALKGDANDLL